MISDLDVILLSEAERKRIDEQWVGSGIKGRKPDSYLNRLKKLHQQAIDVSGCHSIPNYGQFNSAIELLADTDAYKEAYDEWLTLQRYDNLNGTISGDEIIDDRNGNLWLRLVHTPILEKLKRIKAARKEGHETSLSHRKYKSSQAAMALLKDYRESNPEIQVLKVSEVADWAVQIGKCPADKKSRRNLTVRLRRYLSSNEARLLQR